MRLLVLPDFFSGLKEWYVFGKRPKGMPSAYNFFEILGRSDKITFDGILVNKFTSRTVEFENGSTLRLYKLPFFGFHLIWKAFALIYTLGLAVKYEVRNGYNLIYGMAVFTPVAVLVAKIFRKKSIGRMFGTLSTKMIREKRWKDLYFRNALDVLAVVFPADLTIATQDGTEFEFFAKYFGKVRNLRMYYNGIDHNLRSDLLNIPMKHLDNWETGFELKFLCVARFTHWKRHDIVLAFIEHLSKLMKVSLSIYGEGELRGDILNSINSNNLNEIIKVYEPIPQVELQKVFQEHHASLFFYDNGNLGNALWESCLAGQLICIRDSGDLTNVFYESDCAVIFRESTSPKEMANQFYRNYNADNLNRMKLEVRQRVKNTIPSWEERFSSEINEIIDLCR